MRARRQREAHPSASFHRLSHLSRSLLYPLLFAMGDREIRGLLLSPPPPDQAEEGAAAASSPSSTRLLALLGQALDRQVGLLSDHFVNR